MSGSDSGADEADASDGSEIRFRCDWDGGNTEDGGACEGGNFNCDVDGLDGVDVAEIVEDSIFNDQHSRANRSYEADLSMLTPASCAEAASFRCACEEFCTLKCGITGLDTARLRKEAHGHSLTDGSLRHFIACRLRGNTVFDLGGGGGGEGPKRKHQSYYLNNVEVCSETFRVVMHLSQNLLAKASAEAGKEIAPQPMKADARLASAEALNCSVERLNVVAFVLAHVVASGAELLPFGTDLKRATAFHNSIPGAGESADELSIVRLLEGSGATLYERYIERSNSGLAYPTVSLSVFIDVFKNDKRLQHIKTARIRNSFSICDECEEFKTFSFNRFAAPNEITMKKEKHIQHLLLVSTERMVATVCGQDQS